MKKSSVFDRLYSHVKIPYQNSTNEDKSSNRSSKRNSPQRRRFQKIDVVEIGSQDAYRRIIHQSRLQNMFRAVNSSTLLAAQQRRNERLRNEHESRKQKREILQKNRQRAMNIQHELTIGKKNIEKRIASNKRAAMEEKARRLILLHKRSKSDLIRFSLKSRDRSLHKSNSKEKRLKYYSQNASIAYIVKEDGSNEMKRFDDSRLYIGLEDRSQTNLLNRKRSHEATNHTRDLMRSKRSLSRKLNKVYEKSTRDPYNRNGTQIRQRSRFDQREHSAMLAKPRRSKEANNPRTKTSNKVDLGRRDLGKISNRNRDKVEDSTTKRSMIRERMYRARTNYSQIKSSEKVLRKDKSLLLNKKEIVKMNAPVERNSVNGNRWSKSRTPVKAKEINGSKNTSQQIRDPPPSISLNDRIKAQNMKYKANPLKNKNAISASAKKADHPPAKKTETAMALQNSKPFVPPLDMERLSTSQDSFDRMIEKKIGNGVNKVSKEKELKLQEEFNDLDEKTFIPKINSQETFTKDITINQNSKKAMPSISNLDFDINELKIDDIDVGISKPAKSHKIKEDKLKPLKVQNKAAKLSPIRELSKEGDGIVWDWQDSDSTGRKKARINDSLNSNDTGTVNLDEEFNLKTLPRNYRTDSIDIIDGEASKLTKQQNKQIEDFAKECADDLMKWYENQNPERRTPSLNKQHIPSPKKEAETMNPKNKEKQASDVEKLRKEKQDDELNNFVSQELDSIWRNYKERQVKNKPPKMQKFDSPNNILRSSIIPDTNKIVEEPEEAEKSESEELLNQMTKDEIKRSKTNGTIDYYIEDSLRNPVISCHSTGSEFNPYALQREYHPSVEDFSKFDSKERLADPKTPEEKSTTKVETIQNPSNKKKIKEREVESLWNPYSDNKRYLNS